MNIEELLNHVPLAVRDSVEDAYRRHGQLVRSHVRDEIRLRLQAPEIRRPGMEDHGVPVNIEEGLPRSLKLVSIPENQIAPAVLAPWVPTLRSLVHAGSAIDGMLHDLACSLQGVPETVELHAAPKDAARLAQSLLAIAERFDLTKFILEINEDVLGVYTWKCDGKRASITLFKGVIALVAQALGVGAEALTMVVLAHELAHAFTHLGYDIDGNHGSPWFDQLDRSARESLAQYYAARVADRLDWRVPGTLNAYQTLLPKQPPAYQGHVRWCKSATPESVRAALIRARADNVKSYDDLDQLVSDMTSSMNRRKTIDHGFEA